MSTEEQSGAGSIEHQDTETTTKNETKAAVPGNFAPIPSINLNPDLFQGVSVDDLYQHAIKLHERKSLNTLITGAVPDNGKREAFLCGSIKGLDYRWNEVGAGDEIERRSTGRLKREHDAAELIVADQRPDIHAIGSGDLPVLTVLAMKRTACEEDHAGTMLPCDRGLFAPVETGPGHTYGIALAADPEGLPSIYPAEIRTKLAA